MELVESISKEVKELTKNQKAELLLKVQQLRTMLTRLDDALENLETELCGCYICTDKAQTKKRVDLPLLAHLEAKELANFMHRALREENKSEAIRIKEEYQRRNIRLSAPTYGWYTRIVKGD